MGQIKIVVKAADSDQSISDKVNPVVDDAQALSRLVNWLEGGTVRGVNVNIESGGVQATGTFTLTSPVGDGDTAVINGVTLTARTTPTLAAEFAIGTSAIETAKNLAALINSLATVNIFVVASAAALVVTVNAINVGAAGDAITTTATGNIAAGGATLASGASGTVTPLNLGRIATA